jgi:hypothetical protein
MAPLFVANPGISLNLEIPAHIAAGAITLSRPTGVTMPMPVMAMFSRIVEFDILGST